ncbi:hypothetical protein F5Y15DRAFT_413654 [Xylariaceae sp. FL0016]|nr:hypothetical protein F5Y15DRAFT_413654 [Xylariaceae sp. FL0016]
MTSRQTSTTFDAAELAGYEDQDGDDWEAAINETELPRPKTPAQGIPSSHRHDNNSVRGLCEDRSEEKAMSKESGAQVTTKTTDQLIQPTPAKPSKASKHVLKKGYDTRRWDGKGPPIQLLGSYMDPIYLGKWIYNSTKNEFGLSSSEKRAAGDLRLQLEHFTTEMGEAEEVKDLLKSPKKWTQLDEFLDVGDEIISRLKWLVKRCARNMLDKDKKLKRDACESFARVMFGLKQDETLELTTDITEWTDEYNTVWEEVVQRYSKPAGQSLHS